MKDPLIFLQHIVESLELIEQYTKNLTKEAIGNNIEKQDSIEKRIMVIGEATKNLPQEIRLKYKKIPWKKMAGMRDVMIHRYYGISINDTWAVIKTVPKLKKQIQKIIHELQNEV